MAAYSKADFLADGTIRPGAQPVIFGVRWYEVPRTYPPMPWPHYFSSRTWDEGVAKYNALLGEVWGYTPLDETPRPTNATATRYCGKAAHWQAGVGFDPAIRDLPRDAQNLPTCCGGQVVAAGDLGLSSAFPGPDTLTLRSVPLSKGYLRLVDVSVRAKQYLALSAPSIACGGLGLADPYRLMETLGLGVAVQGDNLAVADVSIAAGSIALLDPDLSAGSLALAEVPVARGGLALKDTVHGDAGVGLADVPLAAGGLGLNGSYNTFDNLDLADVHIAAGELALVDVPQSVGQTALTDVPIAAGQLGLSDGGAFGDGLAVADGGAFGDGLALADVAPTNGSVVLSDVPMIVGNVQFVEVPVSTGRVTLSEPFTRAHQLALTSPQISAGGLGLADFKGSIGDLGLADGLAFGDGLGLADVQLRTDPLALADLPISRGGIGMADVPLSLGSLALQGESTPPAPPPGLVIPVGSNSTSGVALTTLRIPNVTCQAGILSVHLYAVNDYELGHGVVTVLWNGVSLTVNIGAAQVHAGIHGTVGAYAYPSSGVVPAGTDDIVITTDTPADTLIATAVNIPGLATDCSGQGYPDPGGTSTPRIQVIWDGLHSPMVTHASFLMIAPGGAFTWSVGTPCNQDVAETVLGHTIQLTDGYYLNAVVYTTYISLAGVTPSAWISAEWSFRT